MIFWTDELFVLSHSFILHRNPGHNVKTTLIKTIVKVKVKVYLSEDSATQRSRVAHWVDRNRHNSKSSE